MVTKEQWTALTEAFDAILEEDRLGALMELARRPRGYDYVEPEWARDLDETDGVQ